jgi:hypothetical protein
VVDSTPEDAERAMRYNLANGCKEGLVAHPRAWPGAQAAPYFFGDGPLVGRWVDGEALRAARRRRPEAPVEAFARPYAVVLSKLPHLAHLDEAAYGQLMRRWCDEEAERAAAERASEKRALPGPIDWVQALRVDARPAGFVATPAPPVHACHPERRRSFLEGYKAHVSWLKARRAALRVQLEAEGFGGVGVSPVGWQVPKIWEGGVGGSRAAVEGVEGRLG